MPNVMASLLNTPQCGQRPLLDAVQ